MDKKKSINDYIKIFNEVINLKKFPSGSAADLSRSVLYYIKDEFPEIQEYAYNQFYLEEEGIIKHSLCDINYSIKFYFKISTKRSKKRLFQKQKSKCLNYIGESPVKFNNYEIRVWQPIYKLIDKKIKLKSGWSTDLDIEFIEVDKSEKIEDIINKISIVINDVESTLKIKENIVMDFIKKALLNKKFYNEVHFENFLTDGIHFDIDKIYQFVKDNDYLE